MPVFDIALINNTENTILLKSIEIFSNLLPIALAGTYKKPSGTLKVTAKYSTKLDYGDMNSGGKTTIELSDPIYAYPKTPFRFQIQLTQPLNMFIKIKLAFNFSCNSIISPDFFFNSEKGTSGRIIGLS